MSVLGTEERPLRVAIIGSGPSGFYAADSLFKSELSVNIDMFDRLATPFGLVRHGVAPDHPKIKNVTKLFERIATKDGFNFFGNVTIGKDIKVSELEKYYDAIIFACGAETDRKLGINGEDLIGSYTATEFVAWYNGHPDYRDRHFDLSQEVAVVIGQGNVAMDVSRILVKTVDELKETDIASHALEALANSKIKEIYLVGRRGPVQAAFTEPEIKEMGKLSDCDVIVDPKDLDLSVACQAELDDPKNKHAQKNFAVLKEYAQRSLSGKSKKLYIKFFQSPISLDGDKNLNTVKFGTNELIGEAFGQKAKSTGETFDLNAGLLFRSVGYRGIPMDEVPFNQDRGTFLNKEGRIFDENGNSDRNLYVTGWIKRGPSGVIGTNKVDSAETVKNLLEDVSGLSACSIPSTEEVIKLLKGRQIRSISFEEWKKIDAIELSRGEEKGKTREKFTRIEDILEVLQ